eukprot:1226177-Amphidinium_carterae.1
MDKKDIEELWDRAHQRKEPDALQHLKELEENVENKKRISQQTEQRFGKIEANEDYVKAYNNKNEEAIETIYF